MPPQEHEIGALLADVSERERGRGVRGTRTGWGGGEVAHG